MVFCLVGDLEDDDGDGSDSENSAAVTDSEDEDECYQEEAVSGDVMAELRVGCMRKVNLPGEGDETADNDQYEEPLEKATTVDFLGAGLKIDTAEDARPVVSAIDGISRLVTLRLSGNTISPEGAQAEFKIC